MISLSDSCSARFRWSESTFVVRVFLCGPERGARVVVPLVALFPCDYFQPVWMGCKRLSQATVPEAVP